MFTQLNWETTVMRNNIPLAEMNAHTATRYQTSVIFGGMVLFWEITAKHKKSTAACPFVRLHGKAKAGSLAANSPSAIAEQATMAIGVTVVKSNRT